jgi:hypothetical protein
LSSYQQTQTAKTEKMSVEIAFKVTFRSKGGDETRRYRFAGDAEPSFALLHDLVAQWWPTAEDGTPRTWQYQDSDGDIVTLCGTTPGEWVECLRHARAVGVEGSSAPCVKIILAESAPALPLPAAPPVLLTKKEKKELKHEVREQKMKLNDSVKQLWAQKKCERKQAKEIKRALLTDEEFAAKKEERRKAKKERCEQRRHARAQSAEDPITETGMHCEEPELVDTTTTTLPQYYTKTRLGALIEGIQAEAFKTFQTLWKKEAGTATTTEEVPPVNTTTTEDTTSAVPPLDADAVATILTVFPGLQQATVEAALRSTNGDVHKAVDILLS